MFSEGTRLKQEAVDFHKVYHKIILIHIGKLKTFCIFLFFLDNQKFDNKQTWQNAIGYKKSTIREHKKYSAESFVSYWYWSFNNQIIFLKVNRAFLINKHSEPTEKFAKPTRNYSSHHTNR